MQTTNSEMNLILYKFWSEDVDFDNNLGLEISYCQHYKHPFEDHMKMIKEMHFSHKIFRNETAKNFIVILG